MRTYFPKQGDIEPRWFIIDAEGKVLGRLNTGQRTANCKFGDDGKTLFICADMYLCRVKTNVVGTNY